MVGITATNAAAALKEEHLKTASFLGDGNIGLFGVVSEKYALLPEKSIDVGMLTKNAVYATIGGTRLCGIFAAGNSKGLLVPATITERELEILKSSLKSANVNVCVINSKYTAIGNLVLCNDNGAIISPALKNLKRQISECLGVEATVGTLCGLSIVGALGVATNRGFLLGMNSSEEDFRLAQRVFKTKGDIGTVNFGSEFVKSGILANSKGIIIGSATTGPEISRIDEALGFL